MPPKPAASSPSQQETASQGHVVLTATAATEKTTKLAEIKPYFDTAQSAAAATALVDDQLQDALKCFDEFAMVTQNNELKSKAQFLAAYLAYYTGDPKRAHAQLPKFATQYPLLADVTYEVAALAAYQLEKYSEVIALAQKIKDENATSAMIWGDAKFQLGQFEEALLKYRYTLQKWPTQTGAESKAKIVQCITEITTSYQLPQKASQTKIRDNSETELDSDNNTIDSDDMAKEPTVDTASMSSIDNAANFRTLIDEALALITRMRSQSPGTKWTKEAASCEQTLQKRIGQKSARSKKETRVAENLYKDAHEHMLKRRHDKALKAYTKAIKFAKKLGHLECKARYEQAIVTGFKREHSNAATLFGQIAKECNDPEIKLKSLYKAGKSCMASNQFREAAAHFASVEKLFHQHSYADDARLHGARSYLALGNEKRFLKMLLSLPDDYPNGDMRNEALWIGTKHALENEQLEKAKEILEKYFQMFPLETGWYTAGRAGYWFGRVLEQLGDIDNALDKYEYVITTTPFSFYMVMAYSRLAQQNSLRAQMLSAELAPAVGHEDHEIPKTLLLEGTFAQGVELIRLGLITRGTKLIKRMLQNPETSPEVHRAAAALFRHVGSFTDAKEISTSMHDGWQKRYPTGDDYALWTLAYPKAFNDQVTLASVESGIDKALIFAIMREESGFNHKIESWANAMGLMQLILPTARSMGKQLGIKVTRKKLTHPETNIRLGAAYLAYLGKMFEVHPALIVPGYNAGGGAVNRWLKERGKMPLDMFIESIPYEQTRGYTKRVLATYATYKFLYGEERSFFTIDFQLPAKKR